MSWAGRSTIVSLSPANPGSAAAVFLGFCLISAPWVHGYWSFFPFLFLNILKGVSLPSPTSTLSASHHLRAHTVKTSQSAWQSKSFQPIPASSHFSALGDSGEVESGGAGVSEGTPSVLVYWCCPNKLPQSGGWNNRCFFSHHPKG